MGAKFTWQEKFTRAIEKMPDELVPAFVRAVLAYGTDGVEPDLSFPLDAIFETFREDIDYSKNARKSGSKGGRASRDAPGDCGDSSKGCEDPSEGCGNPSEGLENPSNPIQDIAIQGIAIQGRTKEEKRTRFRPPTAEEVSAYAAEAGLAMDAGRFCDFYASKGWKVGREPMRDWKAAARGWAARDGNGKVVPSARDAYSAL